MCATGFNVGLLIFLITLLPVQSLFAADSLSIAVSEYSPYVIVDGDIVSGIDVELADLLAARLELNLQHVRCPWKRCLLLAKNGEIDLLPGVFKRSERMEFIAYIHPAYLRASKAFYSLKGDGVSIKAYSDLKSFRIGVERGASAFLQFDNDNTLDKYELPNLATMIKMLDVDRLDAFVAATIPTDYSLIRNGLRERISKSTYVYSGEDSVAYFGLSKTSQHHSNLSSFNRVMSELEAEGEISKILVKYGVSILE